MSDACFAEPQAEHQWLQQLVGDWTSEHECDMGSGQPPQKLTGVETVRSVGGLWIVCEGRGDTPEGGEAFMMLSLGFDPAKKAFVGTFLSSMMTNLWVYEGRLDASGKVLTLDTEGPSFSGDGTSRRYQDIIEIVSPEHRLLRSQILGDDGNWHGFMTAHYRRTR